METTYHYDGSVDLSIHKLLALIIISVFFSFTSNAQSSWNQLGADIDGAMGNGYGSAVALSSDGSIVAIGASSTANFRGAVAIYELSGGGWSLLGDTLKGSSSGDNFGSAVSLSADGTTVVIGASESDGGFTMGSLAGHAQVYDYTGGTWTQRGSDILAAAEFENLGTAISLSSDGNVVAVGAPGAAGGGINRGAVRVYKWNASSWDQVGADITGSIDGERNGSSVSLKVAGTDTIVAVGSPQYYTALDFFSAENEGRVRIFTLAGNDWGVPEELIGNPFQSLGAAVSLSDDGTRLLAGAPYDYIGPFAPGPFVGRVLVYENNSGWSQLGNTIVSATEQDEFGVVARISGDGSRVIVGAPRPVITESPNGRVEVYEYGTDWTRVGDIIEGEAADDGFGATVAISNDGSKVGLGAPLNDDGGADAGHARVFEFGVPPSNALPVITAAQGLNVDEDATDGTSLGTVIATDADAGTTFSNWSITAGNDDGVFAIGASSGELTIASNATLDFETTASYTLTLTVSDGIDTSAPVEVSITVNDIDETAPTVTVASTANSPTNANTIPVTITFSKEVTGFTIEDINVTNGEKSNFDATNNPTFTVDIMPIADGELTVQVAAAVAKDLADNNNTASNLLSITYDATDPTVEIQGAPVAINDRAFSVTFEFSEDVTGFDGSSVTSVNADLDNFLSIDANTYTADITPDGEGDITIDIAANVAQDAASNGNTAATQVMVTYDVVAPRAGIQIPEKITSVGATVQIYFSEENSFPEAINGLELSDIIVTNGSPSNLTLNTESGIPNIYDVFITPNGDGDVTIDIAAGVVTDLAGNANTAAESLMIPFDDGIAPIVTVYDLNANEASPELTGTVDDPEATISVTVDDQTSEATNNGDGTWTLAAGALDPFEEGVYTVSVVATDRFDLDSEEATGSLTVDLTPPAVSFYVTNLDGAGNIIFTNSIEYINNDNTIRVGVIFDEAVEGFDLDGVDLEGADKSNFISYGIDETTGNDQYSIDATPDGSGDDLLIVVTVGAATDLAGNESERGEYTVIYDVTAPQVTSITTAGNINGATVPIRITFNERVIGLTNTDLTVGNGAVSGNPTTLDSLTYTINIAPAQEGNVTVQLTEGSVQDLAGNASTAASEVRSFLYDRTAPTATITAPDIATANPVTITVTFSEVMQPMVADDLTLTNGTVAEITTLDNISYTVEITPVDPSEDGPSITGFDMTVALGTGEVLDRAGNGNLAAATQTILFDDIAPTISFVDFREQPIVTANGDFGGFFIFSESEAVNLNTNDIEVEGGTFEYQSGDLFNTDTTLYAISVTINENAEQVLITIPEGVVEDAAGNENVETTFTVGIDTEAPTVVVSSTVSGPTKVNSIPITLTFSEKVTRLESRSISVSGPFSVSDFATKDSLIYTANVAPNEDVNEGDLALTISAGRFEDLAGNENVTSAPFTLRYDAKPPGVTIAAPEAVNSTDPFTVTFTFDEAHVSFDEADVSFDETNVSVTNGALGVITTGADNNYTGQVTPSGEGDIAIVVDGFTDAAGNTNENLTEKTILYDVQSPTLTFSGVSDNVGGLDPVTLTFTFSEPVTGFTIDDIGVSNGSAGNFNNTNAQIYTADISPSSLGSVGITVPRDVAFDIAENGNEAKSLTISFEQLYSGGSGTEAAPYLIANKEDYQQLTRRSEDWSKYFSQITDIDFGGEELSRIGNFSGTYDGHNFHLTNFRSAVKRSLIRFLEPTGVLKNIKVTNDYNESYTSGAEFSVFVFESKGLIQGCSYVGAVNLTFSRFTSGINDQVGIIAFQLSGEGRIIDSWVDATISMTRPSDDDSFLTASGLVHSIGPNAAVLNSSTHGSITLRGQDRQRVSGICNSNEGLIENTFSDMNLSAVSTESFESTVRAGGIVDQNEKSGIIRQCHFVGAIRDIKPEFSLFGSDQASGLANNNNGLIENSYATTNFLDNASGSTIVTVNGEEGRIIKSFAIGSSRNAISSNFGKIIDCYVIGFGNQSPMVDLNFTSGSVSNSFTNLNALIEQQGGIAVGSFWQSETGTVQANQGGVPKSPIELRTLKTYEDANWDISQGENTIWRYFPFAYPVHNWTLKREGSITLAGTVVKENGTAFSDGTIEISSLINGLASASTGTINTNGEFSIELPVGLHAVSVKSNSSDYQKTFFGNTANFLQSLAVSYDFPNMRIQMVPKGASLLTGNGSVTGRVVRAANGSGRIVSGRVLDGEGIQDVGISLIRTSDNQLMTTVSTDETGGYEITGIPAGEYRLELAVVGLDVDLEGSTFIVDEEGTPITISAAVGTEGIAFVIEAVALGVEDEIALSIYPNPSADYVNIEVQGNAILRVIDLGGSVRLERDFLNTTRLDVSQFKEGVHLLEIRTTEGVAVRKLVKR